MKEPANTPGSHIAGNRYVPHRLAVSKKENPMEKQPKDILKDLAADVLDNQVRPQDMGPETFKTVFSTPSMLTATLIVENLNRTEVDYFK